MLLRIVKMQFKEECVEDFQKLFNKTYIQIRNFDGCRFLELYQDDKDAFVFFTISKWESEEKLDIYRNSALFRNTWAITRTYFSAPPIAYSLLKNLPAGRQGVEDVINPF